MVRKVLRQYYTITMVDWVFLDCGFVLLYFITSLFITTFVCEKPTVAAAQWMVFVVRSASFVLPWDLA